MNSIDIDRELVRKILLIGAIISSTLGSLFAVKKIREYFSSDAPKVQVVKGKNTKPQKKGPKSAVSFSFEEDDDEEDDE